MIGILKGLATTFSTFTRRPVTIQYPDEKHELSERQRSFPVLTWDFDHDEPFCTGCNICVRNCPVDCMTAVMHDNPKHPEGTSDRRKIIEKFWIDYARCMRCNICIEVCPFEAITMDNTWEGHEQATYDRRDLHKDIEDLLEGSKSGKIENPFRPLDSIETNAALAEGEEAPAIGFAGARPEARQAQADRIAQGLGAAIQEREPEVTQEFSRRSAQRRGRRSGHTLAAQAARAPHEGGTRGSRRARGGRGERGDDRGVRPLRQRAVHGDHGEPCPHRRPPPPQPLPAAPPPAGDVATELAAQGPRPPHEGRAHLALAHRAGRGSAGMCSGAERHGSDLYKEIRGNDPSPQARLGRSPRAAPAGPGAQGDPNSHASLRAAA